MTKVSECYDQPATFLVALPVDGLDCLSDCQVDVWAGLCCVGLSEPRPAVRAAAEGRPAGPGSGMGWRVCAGHELELGEQQGAVAKPEHEAALRASMAAGQRAWGFATMPTPPAWREETKREVREAVGDWVKSWDEEHVVRGYVSRLGDDPAAWPGWELRALTQTFIDRGWL